MVAALLSLVPVFVAVVIIALLFIALGAGSKNLGDR